MLKYRLYDIDVIINRALVYGALTAVLIGSYFAIVIALSRLLNPLTRDSDVAVAASTLAVAALFRPLRARIQRFIDRRFYDPSTTRSPPWINLVHASGTRSISIWFARTH